MRARQHAVSMRFGSILLQPRTSHGLNDGIYLKHQIDDFEGMLFEFVRYRVLHVVLGQWRRIIRRPAKMLVETTTILSGCAFCLLFGCTFPLM